MMRKIYCLLLMICMATFCAHAQSSKVDVEIHAGGNASIYIDGSKTAAGKGSVTVQLSLGKHTAKATLPNCNPVTKSFTVTSSYASRIVKLGTPQPKPRTDADLTFVVDNNALIFINDEPAPVGYGTATITLPFGTHKVTAKLANHESTEKTIEVNAKTPTDPIQLEAPKEQQGELAITSDPSEAGVEIDGVWQAYTTPATAILKAGIHDITLSKTGYEPVSTTLIVEPNTRVTYEETLIKKAQPASTTATNGTATKEPTRAQLKRWDYYADKGKYRVQYFGFGFGIGTAATFDISAFDFRLGLIEIRPLVWGLNYNFVESMPHSKLEYIVHPNPVGTNYQGRSEYSMASPTRDIQWYYTPMVRLFIPCSYRTAFTIGIGPQISWTKVFWFERTDELPKTSSYHFDSAPFPKSGYQKDRVWFTCELSYMFTYSIMDWNLYLRYQDGIMFGVGMRFGKKY